MGMSIAQDKGRIHFAITDAPQTSATSGGFTSDTPIAPTMPSALQRISSMTQRLQLVRTKAFPMHCEGLPIMALQPVPMNLRQLMTAHVVYATIFLRKILSVAGNTITVVKFSLHRHSVQADREAMQHRRTLKQDDPMVAAAVASTEAKLRQASLSGNRKGTTAGYGSLAADSAHADSSSGSNTPPAGAGQGRPSGRPSTQNGGRRLLQNPGGYGTDSAANMIGALRAASLSSSGSTAQPAGAGQGRPGGRPSTQSGGRRSLHTII